MYAHSTRTGPSEVFGGLNSQVFLAPFGTRSRLLRACHPVMVLKPTSGLEPLTAITRSARGVQGSPSEWRSGATRPASCPHGGAQLETEIAAAGPPRVRGLYAGLRGPMGLVGVQSREMARTPRHTGVSRGNSIDRQRMAGRDGGGPPVSR